MVEPIGFRVDYAINDFMTDESGELQRVDTQNAYEQWASLKEIYEGLGMEVSVLSGRSELPDMVFCANTFFTLPRPEKTALLSNMAHPERRNETRFTSAWLKENGYEVVPTPNHLCFESMGDAIWDYEGEEIYGGVGPRTDARVYEHISKFTEAKIHKLNLVHQSFYHLDTCLTIFNEKSAAYIPQAFDESGRELIQRRFQNAIAIEMKEAINMFAANAHCPDGENVIVQKGTKHFKEEAQKAGLNIIEVDTSEFMKSGGSVFCMKNQYF